MKKIIFSIFCLVILNTLNYINNLYTLEFRYIYFYIELYMEKIESKISLLENN